MKKVLMALSVFTLISAHDEAVYPESDIDVISIDSRKKIAAQKAMNKLFKKIDPEIKERCINKWDESSACNEFRDLLMAYIFIESYARELFQEVITQSKDKYLNENNAGENT